MNKQVYFHIVDPKLGKKFHPVYQYDYIPLAQGLVKMGYQVFSNMNYWKGLKEDHLFRHHPEVRPEDCSINVFSGLCEHYNYPFDRSLFNNSSVIKVLIEQNDGFITPLFSEQSKKFDLILHKKTKGRKYPANCVSSWAFGLSEEIIEITQLYRTEFSDKKDEILCNFRYGHPVRNYAMDYLPKLHLKHSMNKKTDAFDFTEYDGTRYETMLKENGGRHRPAYLERLAQTKICATFGGFFYFSLVLDRDLFTYRLGNYLLPERAGGKVVNLIRKSGLHLRKTSSVYQWDSWRYWEAFACGSVNLNLDFNYYGIELPVMPENMKHYIGINFDKPRKAAEDMINLDPGMLEQIANNGYNWAIENYSPEAMAKRFLNIVSQNTRQVH
jgi:hypothetical protein